MTTTDTNRLAYSGRVPPHARQAAAVRRWGWWYQAEWRLAGMLAYWSAIVGEVLLTPVLYVLAMGVGLGRLVDANAGGAGGVPYLTFVGPGLLIGTVVMSVTGETTYPVTDGFQWNRMYFSRSATPASPAQIVAGELVAIGIRMLAAALIFWAVLLGFGVAGPGSWPVCFVAALAALALGAPIMAYAITVVGEGPGFSVLQRLIVAPMFLFAGTFYPLESMPVWLRWVGWVSPMWHGTQLSRALTYGMPQSGWAVAGHLAFLAAATAVGARLAVRNFTARVTR